MLMINILTFPAAVYLTIAAVCISNRIHQATRVHWRAIAAGLGAVGMWGLYKSSTLQILTAFDALLAFCVISCAIILKFFPRIEV